MSARGLPQHSYGSSSRRDDARIVHSFRPPRPHIRCRRALTFIVETHPAMLQPQTTPPSEPLRHTDAPHPFDLTSADLILRTADLVDFHVHSQVLSLASPFFASMLALPQPPKVTSPSTNDAGAASKDVPVVPVSEDSKALELLLRLVYPMPKPHAQMEDAQMMVPALLAATKYDMALPIETMSERLLAIIPKSPLQVWAAACRTGLESVARQAAEALKASRTPSSAEVLSFMDELGDMSGISAGDYYRLKQFLTVDKSKEENSAFTLLSPPPITDRPPSSSLSGSTVSPAAFSTDLPSPDVACHPSSGSAPGTQFFAHQLLLCMHSPILKACIAERREASEDSSNATPATSDSPSNATPVVLEFDEGPEVVATLLHACYDGEEARMPTDLSRLAELLDVSRKYEMARVARWVRAAWDEAAVLHPLEAYFVALSHGLSEYAEAAAKSVLTGPVADTYATVMETAPALQYHRLLAYYDACRQLVRTRLDEISMMIPEHVYMTVSSRDRSSAIYTSVPKYALKHWIAGADYAPNGALKRAFQEALLQAISPGSAFVARDVVRPFVECVASVPETMDSVLDDVRDYHPTGAYLSHVSVIDFSLRSSGSNPARLSCKSSHISVDGGL